MLMLPSIIIFWLASVNVAWRRVKVTSGVECLLTIWEYCAGSSGSTRLLFSHMYTNEGYLMVKGQGNVESTNSRGTLWTEDFRSWPLLAGKSNNRFWLQLVDLVPVLKFITDCKDDKYYDKKTSRRFKAFIARHYWKKSTKPLLESERKTLYKKQVIF